MRSATQHHRRGNVVVLMTVLLPVLIGLGAYSIDVGYIEYTRTRLQAGADSGALAAVEVLPGDQATLNAVALRYANLNNLAGGTVQATAEAGTWNETTSTFATSALADANAVRITVSRPDTKLFLGFMLGTADADVTATAIAFHPTGVGARFIIDDEMIDKDVPAIESLANSLGRDVEQLVRARGFNQGKKYNDNNWTWADNFLDLPANQTLTLPTGQASNYSSNDAGMFDIDHPEFPFDDATSYLDFIKYSESGNDNTKWGSDKTYIKNQLDPLRGVAPVTDGNSYGGFVDPWFVHVSPVTYSDVSTLNMSAGVPQVNAKGLRRGLLAFKIIAVGSDIDGGGQTLPQLTIKTVDPSTIDPSKMKLPSQQSLNIRLVK